jgi:hypothetical protein
MKIPAGTLMPKVTMVKEALTTKATVMALMTPPTLFGATHNPLCDSPALHSANRL